MSDTFEPQTPAEVNAARSAVLAMRTGAVVLAIFAFVWGLARFSEISQTIASAPATASGPAGGSVPASEYLGLLLTMIGICGGSLLLWGVAEALRTLEERTRIAAAELVHTSREPSPAPRPMGSGEGIGAAGAELVALMREVRDIVSLNETQREQRLKVLATEMSRRLEGEVPALLREHNWIEARRRVAAARERFPATTTWDALDRQIEQVRSTLEGRDLESAERQLGDLVSLEAWDRVSSLVRELLDRHPDSPRVREFSQRAARERDKAEAEERGKLMSAAQEATNRRDWTAALNAVTQFLRKYPRSPEAADLRLQLPTLTANAEIQTRQRLEAEFRDLLKEQKYEAALQVARDVIDTYPNSPQAAVLREQLPKLEELAGVK